MCANQDTLDRVKTKMHILAISPRRRYSIKRDLHWRAR